MKISEILERARIETSNSWVKQIRTVRNEKQIGIVVQLMDQYPELYRNISVYEIDEIDEIFDIHFESKEEVIND